MSAQTFYFIGDPDQMETAASEHAPLENALKSRLGFEAYKFFDNYNHKTLCKLLEFSPYECVDCEKQKIGELAFVSLLPKALTEHIAQCGPKALDQLTTRWCDEMQKGGERWTAKDMLPIVKKLRKLILKADHEGKRVLHFQFLC